MRGLTAFSSPLPLGRLPPLGKGVLAGLALAVVALSVRLWPQWRHNPDLSHGLFMPLVFLLLLHESRQGPPRFLASAAASRFGFTFCLVGGVAALVAAGLYAAAVDWSHALVNLMLALSLAAFLGAALMVFARDSVRLIAFNWTAVAAIALWVLTAPIPPGSYSRLTLSLQLWVSEGVLRTLHLSGIAAIRHGNVIELAHASVGVEEACSGVRSLISCVFAGIFFSATLVRGTWARVAIIALAAPLAFAMNFVRSLLLTLLANRGVDIAGTWHDVTGFAVLAVTAGILGGLALLLERGERTERTAPATADARVRSPASLWVLGGALALAAALVGFFVANTRPAPHRSAPVPDLFALLPATASGWEVKTTNLYEFSGTLRTDHLAQRTYIRASGAVPTQIIIYVAYWRAGQVPVSLVASHTPDACWPGSGWTEQRTSQERMRLPAGERVLPEAEYRLFQGGDYPQHVWFWHLYDRKPIAYQDPYSAVQLLRLAWRHGFRRDGDQLFIRISSNRPWAELATEPLVLEFFRHTQAVGL